jgi:hypothetical protein
MKEPRWAPYAHPTIRNSSQAIHSGTMATLAAGRIERTLTPGKSRRPKAYRSRKAVCPNRAAFSCRRERCKQGQTPPFGGRRMNMELTHERWKMERRYLQEAIVTAEQKDPQGLLAEAFRRAFARLEKRPEHPEHPEGSEPDDAQMQA